jgi:WD40 repeat protein
MRWFGGGGVAGRHAVTIGLSAFARHDGEPLEPLPFAPALTRELAAVLADLGYATTTAVDPDLPSKALGDTVREHWEAAGADGLLVVHLLSHGHPADGEGTVYALGSDGAVHGAADVDHWLKTVQNEPARPLTLFLLDLCSAGTAATLPWQTRVDPDHARAWVIAACQSGRSAYDGRFTQALTNVLRAVSRGELDVDPALAHVPLPTVARAVHQEVNRLAAAADSYGQRVTASLMDIAADPDLPFFRNAGHSTSPRLALRTTLEPALLPFLDDLDEGLDARHFLDRATGVGAAGRTGELIGCFTGRDRELRRLSPWMNGHGPGSLCVVTGSPGVGKSALLGVLVCAAHPTLRPVTRPVWDRVTQSPLPIQALAAVHARRRGLSAVVASLARQLGLPEVGTAAFVAAVVAAPTPPVVVLDALDEADDPAEIAAELLLPLADARRADGQPAARVLVGVRRYPEYAALLDRAAAADRLVDLDDVPADVLEDDLNRYVGELLRTTPTYRGRYAVSGAFAGRVASVLAHTSRRDWGPFLVAGLYTRHLITSRAPIDDPAEAERLGERVPLGLPEVLELDLGAKPDHPWLRPVMTALAHARGQGMPMSVLARVAPVFGPAGAPLPGVAEIWDALNEGQFYLRQSTDTDHVAVYRLFHQGLADHLGGASPAAAVLDALLRPLGPAEARDWGAAEPYLFRHVLDDAEAAGRAAEILADPGFLLHPGAARALAGVDVAGRPELALLDLVRRSGGEPSRDRLALLAARAGLPDLAHRVANQPGLPPLAWQPRWTYGAVPALPVAAAPGPAGPVTRELARAAGPVDAVAVAADGHVGYSCGGTVRVLRVGDGAEHPEAVKPLAAEVFALAANGRYLATVNATGSVRVTDLSAGTARITHTGAAKRGAVAISLNGGNVVSVGEDGTFHVWSLTGGGTHTVSPRRGGQRWAVALGAHGGYAVSGGEDGSVRLWRALSGDRVAILETPQHPVLAVAVSHRGGRVVFGESTAVQVWDHADGGVRTMPGPRPGDVRPVAISADGAHVVSARSTGQVLLWSPDAGDEVTVVGTHDGPVLSVAVSADGGHVVSGGADGVVRMWSRSGYAAPPPTPGAGPAVCSAAILPDIGGQVVLGDTDGVIRTLRLESGVDTTIRARLGKAPVGTLRAEVVTGAWLVHATSGPNTVLWDPIDGIGVPAGGWPGLLQDAQAVARRATTVVNARAVRVVGNAAGEVLLADLAGTPIGDPLGSHVSEPTVIHCGLLDDAPVALTGGTDGLVQVWDLTTRHRRDLIDAGAPVTALDLTDTGDLIVIAGGEAIAYRHVSAL